MNKATMTIKQFHHWYRGERRPSEMVVDVFDRKTGKRVGKVTQDDMPKHKEDSITITLQ